jgi:hypothetical protein
MAACELHLATIVNILHDYHVPYVSVTKRYNHSRAISDAEPAGERGRI